MLACGEQPTNNVNAFDLPTGGQYVNPDIVDCGDSGGCRVNPGQCCVGPGVDGGAECLSDGATTCPASTGIVTCNETADCQINNRCCAIPPGDGGSLSAECATSCPSSQVQLCRTNGECPGDKCIIQKCSDGLIYEMCDVYASPTFACTAVAVFPDGGLDLPSDQ
jgi:hypothetical protein